MWRVEFIRLRLPLESRVERFTPSQLLKITRNCMMLSSIPAMKSLLLICAFALLSHASPESVVMQCPTPIDPFYLMYDECARLCLGCLDRNDLFGHNCEPHGSCCVGDLPKILIPKVFGLVKENCTAELAQETFEIYLRTCANSGNPVDPVLTPGEPYSYVSFCRSLLFDVSCCGAG